MISRGSFLLAEEAMRPLVIIVFGPPGSGRDALVVKLSNSLSIPYISTADLLLDHSDDETEFGKKAKECLLQGLPIPDEMLLDLIKKRAQETDAKKGFLLDGFPRSPEQAEALDKLFRPTHTFFTASIRVSDDWLISHHESRLICTQCGRVYHLQESPPQNTTSCDFCGSELSQRDEDCQENIKKQCENYRQHMAPLLSLYSQKGMCVEVDGTRPFDDILQDIKSQILSEQLNHKHPIPYTG